MDDIIAIGEILIDLIGTGPLQFRGTVGGAPCNALAQAAKLGSRTAFIGMVGQDAFGRICAGQLDELGIDRTHLAVTDRADTTLAFVTLDENGERDFTFYRRPGADTLLCVKHLPFDRIAQCRVYLYGGVSLSRDPTRATVFYSLFKLAGTPVIKAFDPNLRPSLWEDLGEAKALGQKAMGLCDILKLSEEEAVFFSGCQDPLEGARRLQAEKKIPLVLVSMGAKGCSILWQGDCRQVPAYPVTAVDATAAGDSFFGAFLHRLLQSSIDRLDQVTWEQLTAAAQFASAAAALTVSRRGSIPALPTADEVEQFCKQQD